MVDSERGGFLRYLATVVLVISTFALVGCGALLLLPRQNEASLTKLLTANELVAAYGRVQPGLTRASQLSQFGFDATAAHAQVLSYLGVIERFMPRDSVHFDRLDAAIQDCVEARDRCTALVFQASDRVGNAQASRFLTAIGLGADAAEDLPPQVILLIRDGRVAFKMMTGSRNISGRVEASTATQAVTLVAYRSGR